MPEMLDARFRGAKAARAAERRLNAHHRAPIELIGQQPKSPA